MSTKKDYAEGNLVADANDAINLLEEDDLHLQRKKIKRKYWLITIGIVLIFAGYNSYMTLQSSIHVENGVGMFVVGSHILYNSG